MAGWRPDVDHIASGHDDRQEVPRLLQRLRHQRADASGWLQPTSAARRVGERDEQSVTAWRKVTWAEVNGPGGLWGLRLLRRRSRVPS